MPTRTRRPRTPKPTRQGVDNAKAELLSDAIVEFLDGGGANSITQYAAACMAAASLFSIILAFNTPPAVMGDNKDALLTMWTDLAKGMEGFSTDDAVRIRAKFDFDHLPASTAPIA